MPALKSGVRKPPRTTLRKHTKSHGGCRNCKLRKVKCDESQPKCKRCVSYGTFCNYDPRVSDLQTSAAGALEIDITRSWRCSEKQTILSIINTGSSCPGHSSLAQWFTTNDLYLLQKFHFRTAWTLCAAETSRPIYQSAYSKLIFSHPFLFHIVVAFTIMHDRYLGIDSGVDPSTAIPFHWAQGAASLNEKISAGVKPSERDGVWACAGLLGAICFASFPAQIPEEAWPLKPRSSSDLTWMKMSEGKKQIWRLTEPLRPDSIFASLAFDFEQFHLPKCMPLLELQKLPVELVELCEVDETSSLENHAYYGPAFALSQLMEIECNSENMGKFICFFGCISPAFRDSLDRKDPCGLILFAYWYAKLSSADKWWVGNRAVIECQAICIYLERHYSHDRKILKLLDYPKIACGLAI